MFCLESKDWQFELCWQDKEQSLWNEHDPKFINKVPAPLKKNLNQTFGLTK